MAVVLRLRPLGHVPDGGPSGTYLCLANGYLSVQGEWLELAAQNKTDGKIAGWLVNAALVLMMFYFEATRFLLDET